MELMFESNFDNPGCGVFAREHVPYDDFAEPTEGVGTQQYLVKVCKIV